MVNTNFECPLVSLGSDFYHYLRKKLTYADYCTECQCFHDVFCDFELWVGNSFCDDEANTWNCNYDGGDCCGPCVNDEYCSNCTCHLEDEG